MSLRNAASREGTPLRMLLSSSGEFTLLSSSSRPSPSYTVTPKLRRNFGFVFSFTGRAIFIMFCGTLLLATGNNLAYAVGAVTFGGFQKRALCVAFAALCACVAVLVFPLQQLRCPCCYSSCMRAAATLQ